MLPEFADKIINFYTCSDSRELNPQISPDELSKLMNLRLNQTPATLSDLEAFVDDYLKFSVNTNSKNFANQLWSKTEPFSILGEILSACTNTSMYTYEVAPVATLLENKMISYLSELIWGIPTDGIMTSGGSASNLQALMVARNVKLQVVKNQGLFKLSHHPVILAAKNAHYSIKRAVNVLGLGQDNLIEIDTNPDGSLKVDDLKYQIFRLKNQGIKPFCLVSTAGTTVEGSYDHLPDVSTVCLENDMWLHVDGAYGGSVLLSEKYKSLLEGIHLADSFSWDFHKMLGINLPCAFLFLKNRGLLRGTLSSGNDSYLFHEDDEQSLDLGPKSIQCGRKNDILKLWVTWLALGKSGFEERVNKLFQTASQFADLVKKEKKLILLHEPTSINVCFRYNSHQRLEETIRNQLIRDGVAMLNYSKNNEGTFFRMAITRPDLDESDLEYYLKNILMVGNELH